MPEVEVFLRLRTKKKSHKGEDGEALKDTEKRRWTLVKWNFTNEIPTFHWLSFMYQASPQKVLGASTWSLESSWGIFWVYDKFLFFFVPSYFLGEWTKYFFLYISLCKSQRLFKIIDTNSQKKGWDWWWRCEGTGWKYVAPLCFLLDISRKVDEKKVEEKACGRG